MNIVPMFDTAGVETGTFALPSPSDYLHIDEIVLGPRAFNEIRETCQDAVLVGDLEKSFAEARVEVLELARDAFENKLEIEQSPWWRDNPNVMDRRLRVATIVTLLIPRWELVAPHYADRILAIPTEHVGQTLRCDFWGRYKISVYPELTHWDLYWRKKT